MFENKYPYTDFNEYNLDWVIVRIKELTEEWVAYKTQMNADWLEMRNDWASMKEDLEELKTFITTYFDNLDVQEEINNKIDQMAQDGSLLAVIKDTVESKTATTTTAWLDQHITEPEGVVIDTSLTIAGACADAKATGDAIADVNNTLSMIDDQFIKKWENNDITTYVDNKYIGFDGVETSYTNAKHSGNIDVDDFPYHYIKFTGATWSGIPAIVFFNTSDQLITTFPVSQISAGQNYTDEIIQIPNGTSYFIVNNLHGIYATLKNPILYCISEIEIKKIPVIGLPQLNNPLKNSFVEIWEDTGETFPNSDSFISYNGVEESFSDINHSDIIDVSEFETGKILFTGATWSGVPAIVFFDVDNNVVSTLPQSVTALNYNKEIVSIPENTSYFIVNDLHSKGAFNYPIIENVIEYGTKGWGDLKWCCVGDSLTEVNQRTNLHYHDYISNITGINVYNMGVSGTGYARGSENNNAFYQRISSVPVDSDVITIFGSFNDLSAGLELGTASDSGTTTLAGCINTTLDNLFTIIPLANVGIVTPCPWSWTNPFDVNSDATKYCEMIAEICKRRGIPCLDLFHSSLLRPWESSFREIAYSKDEGNGVHPDENGHKLIAPRFEGFLDMLILSK